MADAVPSAPVTASVWTSNRHAYAGSGPLGPDPGLVPALAGRLRAAGVPPGTPVVLAAAGSSDPRAAGDARHQAALLASHLQAPVLAAFASAARPTVGEAVGQRGHQPGVGPERAGHRDTGPLRRVGDVRAEVIARREQQRDDG